MMKNNENEKLEQKKDFESVNFACNSTKNKCSKMGWISQVITTEFIFIQKNK